MHHNGVDRKRVKCPCGEGRRGAARHSSSVVMPAMPFALLPRHDIILRYLPESYRAHVWRRRALVGDGADNAATALFSLDNPPNVIAVGEAASHQASFEIKCRRAPKRAKLCSVGSDFSSLGDAFSAGISLRAKSLRASNCGAHQNRPSSASCRPSSIRAPLTP